MDNNKNKLPNDVLLKIKIAIASGKEELLPELNAELRNIFF